VDLKLPIHRWNSWFSGYRWIVCCSGVSELPDEGDWTPTCGLHALMATTIAISAMTETIYCFMILIKKLLA
jgi:hypothetical protein